GVGTVDVAGHSLGGWVVLELAKLGRARSVAALCPGGFFTPAERAWAKTLLRFSAWSARRYGERLAPRWESPRTRTLLLGGSFGHPRPRAARGDSQDHRRPGRRARMEADARRHRPPAVHRRRAGAGAGHARLGHPGPAAVAAPGEARPAGDPRSRARLAPRRRTLRPD